MRIYIPSVMDGTPGQVPTIGDNGEFTMVSPAEIGATVDGAYLIAIANPLLPDAEVVTAAGLALAQGANAAAQRVTLGLGTAAVENSGDFDPAGSAAAAQAASQPLDADLTAIAALVSAADRVPYATGAGAWALAVLTSVGRNLVAAVDAAAQRVVLGLGSAAVANTGDFDAEGSAAAAQAAAEATAAAALAAKKLDDLAAPDDNTDLDASTAKHGLMKKYPGGTSNFLRADGAFAAPTASVAATTVEKDLGSTPTWRGKFTITDAAIDATKKILCWQAPGPYTGKGTLADESEMQPVSVISVEPLAGSAVVRWQTPPMVVETAEESLSPNFGGGSAANSGTNRDRRFIAKRLGKIRGQVKFTYMVMA